MDVQLVREVIERAEALGFVVGLPHSSADINEFADVRDRAVHIAAEDAEQAWADAIGISKELYQKVAPFYVGHPTCTGTNKKGAPCKTMLFHRMPHPKKFRFGVHDRCEHHREP